MSQLRRLAAALRSPTLSRLPPVSPIPRLPLRTLSTEGEPQDSSADPFLQPPEGLVYGRLSGVGKNTLKTDVIHFLEGCNLSTDDVKVDYNRAYNPVGMLLQFPSRAAFETAARQIIRKGRVYRLEKADRAQWDLMESFNGKAVMLQGVPRNAVPEDVERFLSGCNYDPSSFQTFLRPGTPDPVRITIVKFPTPRDAMNAFIVRNRGFCLNSPVTMRVLQ